MVSFSISSRFGRVRATQDEPPRVTLIDFGLSKALLEEGDEEAFPLLATSVGKTFVGTPCYLAPEIEAIHQGALRRLSSPSRHRRDSFPSDEVVGGLFFDFEPLRTASGPSRRVGERAVAAMA